MAHSSPPIDTFHHIIHTICAALPPPPADTPESRAHRDASAIAQIASMVPANADEVHLAAQCVAAEAQEYHCQRLAQEHAAEQPTLSNGFLTLALRWHRECRATRALLLRVQSERRKRDADPVAREYATLIEHSAIGLMSDALGCAPPAPTPQPVSQQGAPVHQLIARPAAPQVAASAEPALPDPSAAPLPGSSPPIEAIAA